MKIAAVLGAAAMLWLSGPGHAESVPASVLTFKATQSGRQTLDEGEGGGNPFASALITALSEPGSLGRLPLRIQQLTAKFSDGFQEAEVPSAVAPADLPVAGSAETGGKVVLVVVYSDYTAAPGLPSLPGAARDAQRVGDALRKAGYSTEVIIDPAREKLPALLKSFSDRSASASVALFYTTGHGVEAQGKGYLIPTDYPVLEGAEALPERAVPLAGLAQALRAQKANLFFYGGCRDNPFAE
jgi:hypothetical protein